MQIERVLAELEKAWKEVLPDLATGLLLGLSETEFEALRPELPVNFPEMLKTLYLWHNGQNPEQISFLYHHFYSLEEALFEYQQNRQVSEQIKQTAGIDTWPENYWPIWGFEGEYFLIDLDSGQIYFFFVQDSPRLWYDNLGQMITCLTQAVQNDIFRQNAQSELETDQLAWEKLRLALVCSEADSGPLYAD